MKTTRFAALALAMTMALGTLTGCSGKDSSSAADTGNTLRIGAIAPLTGGASDYGITATNGLKLAVEEVNAKGGILGKQVVVDYQDDENDTTKSVNAYNKLKGDGMVALWGAVTSKPAISVSTKAAKDNMPMMTPTGTATAITDAGSNVFRACFLDAPQAEAMAEYADSTLGAKKVAVLYDITDDYSLGVAETFRPLPRPEGGSGGLRELPEHRHRLQEPAFQDQCSGSGCPVCTLVLQHRCPDRHPGQGSGPQGTAAGRRRLGRRSPLAG